MTSLETAKMAVKALDSKKALDIKVIKIQDISAIADYFVIATGTSSTHVKALADEVEAQLDEAGIRVDVDTRSEKIGYKIREARKARIPYMLVVGEKEEAEGKVSVRSRFLGDEGQKDLGEFIAAIQEEIQNKVNRKVETEE